MVSLVATLFNSRRGNFKILNLWYIGSSRPWVKGRNQGSQCLLQHIVFIPTPTGRAVVLRSKFKEGR